MSIGRAILFAFITLSVAVLPPSEAMANTAPHGTVIIAAQQADCCPDCNPCEKTTDGCGSVVSCIKCFNLTGAVAAPFADTLTPSALEKPALALQSFRSPTEYPPLPPPRI